MMSLHANKHYYVITIHVGRQWLFTWLISSYLHLKLTALLQVCDISAAFQSLTVKQYKPIFSQQLFYEDYTRKYSLNNALKYPNSGTHLLGNWNLHDSIPVIPHYSNNNTPVSLE